MGILVGLGVEVGLGVGVSVGVGMAVGDGVGVASVNSDSTVGTIGFFMRPNPQIVKAAVTSITGVLYVMPWIIACYRFTPNFDQHNARTSPYQ